MSTSERSEDSQTHHRRRGHHGPHHHRHRHDGAEENIVTLYDIPCATLPDNAWSPNTWKTRLALNFKNVPYRTVWVEFPDIEATCRRLGAPPTATTPSGEALYTLPVLHDPSTNKTISDSLAIALYLDDAYPAPEPSGQLFPAGSRALQALFQRFFTVRVMGANGTGGEARTGNGSGDGNGNAGDTASTARSSTTPPSTRPRGAPDVGGGTGALERLMTPLVYTALNPASRAHYRATREVIFGVPLDQLAPAPTRGALWARVREALGEVVVLVEFNDPTPGAFERHAGLGEGSTLASPPVTPRSPSSFSISRGSSAKAKNSLPSSPGASTAGGVFLDPSSPPAPPSPSSTAPTAHTRTHSGTHARTHSDTHTNLYIMGATPTYADFVLGAALLYIKRLAKEREWEEVGRWHGGRWYRLVHALRAWEVVDGHGIAEM